MVTKSFGKSNFMQPMGRPKHALKVPCFFSFYVLVGGGGDFFPFIRASQCVCTMFHQVPNGFPICSPISQFFPLSLYHVTFIPYAFQNDVLLSPILVGQRGGTIYFKIEHSVLGSLHSFIFFEWWANQIGRSPKKIKIKNFGGTSSN
jgi:hypothetical protein